MIRVNREKITQALPTIHVALLWLSIIMLLISQRYTTNTIEKLIDRNNEVVAALNATVKIVEVQEQRLSELENSCYEEE